MKVYAVDRRRGEVRASDPDTGEARAKSLTRPLGEVTRDKEHGGTACSLLAEVRAHGAKAQARAAEHAAEAARARAESPLAVVGDPELTQAHAREALEDPEAASEVAAQEGSSADPESSALVQPESPVAESAESEAAQSGASGELKGDDAKAPEPRPAQGFDRALPGQRPRVPGPVLYEVAPPVSAADRYRPADTAPPPDEEGASFATPVAAAPAIGEPAPPAVESPAEERSLAEREVERAKEDAKEDAAKLAATQPTPQSAEDVKPQAPEEQPEEELENEQAEDAAKQESKAKSEGIDPAAPPEEPIDRAGVENLDLGEEGAPERSGGPGGGGLAGAPELEAWKAGAKQATVDIAKPDLGPAQARTRGMGEHAKATLAKGQKRRQELPKEAKPIFAEKKRSVEDVGKVPEALKDDPVNAVKSIEKVVHKKGLPAQKLPLLRPTPRGYLPNLFGDPISPADLDALKKKYLPPPEKRGKNFDEMGELLKAFNHDLATNPDLKGRVAVFEGQTISGADLPPQPEIAPAHQPDVAAVLARIITESQAMPPAWIKHARDTAYAHQALSIPESFPTLGDDWVPKEAEFLRAEMQRIRDAAGISKEQLDAAIKARQDQLKGDKDAAVAEGDKAYEDAREKVEADFESTGGLIRGLREEWEDWADEIVARETKVDWKAIRDRQRKMERAVEDLANGWIVAYDDMQKTRAQKLGQAAKKQKEAYDAAIEKDKALDLKEAGDDQAKIDAINKDKKYAKFVDDQMKLVREEIKHHIKSNSEQVKAWQGEMRTERKDALDRLQTWGDKQIGRTRGFIDQLLTWIFGWRDEQKSEARAFAQQRARENTAVLGNNLGLLYQKRAQFGDTLDDKEKEQLKLMSEEQRTVIDTYYKNGKDAIGAVAAGMKIRLRNQRVPKIKQAMIKHVMATSTNSADGLRVAHLAKHLGEQPIGAAVKARAGFEWQYGTKESWVFEAMKMVSSTLGAKGLRGAYFNQYSEDFDTRLKSELDGGWPDDPADYDEAQALLKQNKAGAAAAEIRRAVEGAGTDEAKINEVLRRFPPGPERDKVLTEYKAKYGEILEDRLKSELSFLDEDVSIALIEGKDALADAVEIRQAQMGRDSKAMEGVYARIRKEEYARARLEDQSRQAGGQKPLTSAEIELRIKQRQIQLGEEFKGKFKIDFEKSVRMTLYATPVAADLVIGLQEQDFAAVDSARLEIERQGLYADDDTVNQKVLKLQHERAYERHKYDAETQLQQEEQAHLKQHPNAGPWTAEYRLRRKEELLAKASERARGDASKSMQALKGYYMHKYGQHYPEYMGGGTTDPAAFDKVIKGLTQGQGENEAVERLEGDGYLPPERELHFAVKRGDKDAIKAQLNGKSLAQIKRLKDKWLEKNKEPPTFEDVVLGELSGRDKNDMRIQLKYGEPTDPATALKVAEEKLAFEARTGGVDVYGRKRERYADLEMLVDRLRQDKREYEAARADPARGKVIEDQDTGASYFAHPSMGAYQNSWQSGLQSFKTAVDVHRAEVDAETDLVAGVIGMVVAVVVGALLAPFTAGASLGLILLMAGAIAGAATVATIITKQAIKGDAYSEEELLMDAAFGVLDFAITAATLGAGKFIAPMLKGSLGAAQAGKTTVKEAAKRVGQRVVGAGGKPIWTKGVTRAATHQAQSEFAQGLFSSIAVPAFMDEYGDGLNPLASTMLSMGLGMGGGMVIGKGVSGVQRARAADFDFAAQARTKGDSADLIAMRADPEKLKVMQDAYLTDNPHRTASDFLADYDDILLTMMKDKKVKAQWQRQARADMLEYVPQQQRAQFSETPIEMMGAKQFERLTKSARGDAVVIIKDGVPTVIVKQGASQSTLRREAQHLLQAADEKWAAHFKMLDETKLADWSVRDTRDKFNVYNAKLEIEIDAAHNDLKVMGELAQRPDASPRLAGEIAMVERNLDNLYRRQLEVMQIGPLRRTLMAWGFWPEPQYLQQKPRLFNKPESAPPPKTGPPQSKAEGDAARTSSEPSLEDEAKSLGFRESGDDGLPVPHDALTAKERLSASHPGRTGHPTNTKKGLANQMRKLGAASELDLCWYKDKWQRRSDLIDAARESLAETGGSGNIYTPFEGISAEKRVANLLDEVGNDPAKLAAAGVTPQIAQDVINAARENRPSRWYYDTGRKKFYVKEQSAAITAHSDPYRYHRQPGTMVDGVFHANDQLGSLAATLKKISEAPELAKADPPTLVSKPKVASDGKVEVVASTLPPSGAPQTTRAKSGSAEVETTTDAAPGSKAKAKAKGKPEQTPSATKPKQPQEITPPAKEPSLASGREKITGRNLVVAHLEVFVEIDGKKMLVRMSFEDLQGQSWFFTSGATDKIDGAVSIKSADADPQLYRPADVGSFVGKAGADARSWTQGHLNPTGSASAFRHSEQAVFEMLESPQGIAAFRKALADSLVTQGHGGKQVKVQAARLSMATNRSMCGQCAKGAGQFSGTEPDFTHRLPNEANASAAQKDAFAFAKQQHEQRQKLSFSKQAAAALKATEAPPAGATKGVTFKVAGDKLPTEVHAVADVPFTKEAARAQAEQRKAARVGHAHPHPVKAGGERHAGGQHRAHSQHTYSEFHGDPHQFLNHDDVSAQLTAAVPTQSLPVITAKMRVGALGDYQPQLPRAGAKSGSDAGARQPVSTAVPGKPVLNVEAEFERVLGLQAGQLSKVVRKVADPLVPEGTLADRLENIFGRSKESPSDAGVAKAGVAAARAQDRGAGEASE